MREAQRVLAKVRMEERSCIAERYETKSQRACRSTKKKRGLGCGFMLGSGRDEVEI